MKPKLSDLWHWDGKVERRVYLFWGLCLFAIKYNLDRVISSVWFEKDWMLFDVNTVRFYLWQTPVEQVQETYYLTLLAVSLPFLWTGIILTLRRLRSLGWQPWWVLIFFVPFLKLFFFGLLCVLPSPTEALELSTPSSPRAAGRFGRFIPTRTFGSAVMGVIVSVVLGILAVMAGRFL